MGIDAAWTTSQPSGVALLSKSTDGGWRCLGVAPSYATFTDLAAGKPVDWSESPHGESPVPEELLAAAVRLGGDTPSVVAIDMPLSHQPITARRVADQAVSRALGGRGAAVHSPSAARPGSLSDRLREQFDALGIPLVTLEVASPALIEVYPHASLIAMTGANFRLPYKVSRSSKFWPGTTKAERITNLIRQFELILSVLSEQIEDIPLFLPATQAVTSLASLKRFEDSIDALVCAWTAVSYSAGDCVAYGDATAAIWVPDSQGEPAG